MARMPKAAAKNDCCNQPRSSSSSSSSSSFLQQQLQQQQQLNALMQRKQQRLMLGAAADASPTAAATTSATALSFLKTALEAAQQQQQQAAAMIPCCALHSSNCFNRWRRSQLLSNSNKCFLHSSSSIASSATVSFAARGYWRPSHDGDALSNPMLVPGDCAVDLLHIAHSSFSMAGTVQTTGYRTTPVAYIQNCGSASGPHQWKRAGPCRQQPAAAAKATVTKQWSL